MTVIKEVVGLSEALAKAATLKTTPKKPKGQRPAAPYGERGLVISMKPIPSLTPKNLFANQQPFIFQAPPTDTFGEEGQRVHDDYMTVGDGEHSSPAAGASLRTLSFTTLFLDWQPVWTVVRKTGWDPNPKAMIAELRKIKDSGKPFHLLAHRVGDGGKYDVDWAATLRDLQWEMRAGEDDATYITVSFTEFRSPNIAQYLAGSVNHPSLPTGPLTIRTLPSTRNTLAKLARFYYGDPSKAAIIAAKNGIKSFPFTEVLTEKNTHRTTITVGLLPAVKPKVTVKKK